MQTYQTYRVQARVGAPAWLAVIVTLWGGTAAALAAVRGPAEFLVLRVLLGVFEAGTFPTIWCACAQPPSHELSPHAAHMHTCPASVLCNYMPTNIHCCLVLLVAPARASGITSPRLLPESFHLLRQGRLCHNTSTRAGLQSLARITGRAVVRARARPGAMDE